MTLFLWYIWVHTLPVLFPQEISLTDLFCVLFLLFLCSFFSSACLRCNSNFKYLFSLRFDFVFKSLKKYLVISTISYFFYLFQNDSSSGLIALLHHFFFPPTSTLPFIWVSLSNREVEFGVVYKAEQRQKLVLTTLSWLSKIQFLKVLHHVHSSLH